MSVQYGFTTNVSYTISEFIPRDKRGFWKLEVIDFHQSHSVQLQMRAWLQDRHERKYIVQNEWTELKTFDKDNRVASFEHDVWQQIADWTSATFCVQVRPVFEKSVVVPSNTIWMQNLECMFNNEKYADAEIKAADGTLFKVHKAILSAQSDVLEMMFTHECIEKTSNRVQIANGDVEVVEAMLRYIYSGKVEKLKELASRLILLADQYQLKDLTAMCAFQLGVEVSNENVFERLKLLSSIENMSEYKQTVFKFVKENCKEISQSSEWIELGKQHGQILAEYIQFLSSSE
ncbi:Speckle-type POZ protein A-like protein [Aphelenchoides besseyi]|nr:Speckle-type POZ protein A-like protein [Aphelenchoides besseyi]